MVAVVFGFQFVQCLLAAELQPLGQSVDVRTHLSEHLFLGDAAYGCVLLQHADVLYVVELTEDAEL